MKIIYNDKVYKVYGVRHIDDKLYLSKADFLIYKNGHWDWVGCLGCKPYKKKKKKHKKRKKPSKKED